MRKAATSVLLSVAFLALCTTAFAQTRGEGVGALFTHVDGDTEISITSVKTAPWSEVIVENAEEELQAVAELDSQGLVNFTFNTAGADVGSLLIYAVDEAGVTNKILIPQISLSGDVLPPTLITKDEADEDSVSLTGFSYPGASIIVSLTSDKGYSNSFTTTAGSTTGLWELIIDTLEGGNYTAQAVSAVDGQQSQASQKLLFEIEATGLIEKAIEIVTELLESIAEQLDAVIEIISSFTKSITEAIQALPEPIKQAARATSAAAVPITLLSLFLQAGLATAGDLWLLFSQLFLSIGKFSFLPVFIKGRKEAKPWGTLYDSLTKQPLSQGLVRLLDEAGKFIDMEITSKSGAFTFLPREGKYKLEASKAGYNFPSQTVSGKRDGEYNNVYRGEGFEVSEDQPVVDQSIPIDPHDIKKANAISRFFRKHGPVFNIALLTTGLVISVISYLAAPAILNQAIAGFYIVTLALVLAGTRRTVVRWGIVKDTTGSPVEAVALSLVTADTGKLVKRRVTNERGRYQFTAPQGKYKLLVASIEWERIDEKGHYQGEELAVLKETELINVPVVVNKKPETALKRREVM